MPMNKSLKLAEVKNRSTGLEKLTQDIDSNLANLTPKKYIGLAPTITRSTVNKTSKIINHWRTQLAKKQKFYESLPTRLSASL